MRIYDCLGMFRGAAARVWAGALVVSAIMSCSDISIAVAEPTTPAPTTSGHRLSAAELKALLAKGAEFREISPFVGTSARRREFFYGNGRYLGCSDRAPIEGRHFIKDNRLCVQATGSAPSCRQVVGQAGGSFNQRLIWPDKHAGQPLAVTISPIPPGSDCLTKEEAQ